MTPFRSPWKLFLLCVKDHFSPEIFLLLDQPQLKVQIKITPQYYFTMIKLMTIKTQIIMKPSVGKDSKKPTLNSAKDRTSWYFFLKATEYRIKAIKMIVPFDTIIFLEIYFEKIILNEKYFTRYLWQCYL